MDNIDRKILVQLQENCALGAQDIADIIGSSKSVVWRRIQRLQEEGIIKQQVALLDAEKVGFGVLVFAQVKLRAHDKDALPNFINAVQKFPQVIECHTLMGSIDFLMKIAVADIQAYETFFWEKLSKIEGVQEVSSSVGLTKVKETTALPIEF